MRQFLKLLFDQNHHLINHLLNRNFKCHLTFLWTLDEHLMYIYNCFQEVTQSTGDHTL
jgi:hypothetical protein